MVKDIWFVQVILVLDLLGVLILNVGWDMKKNLDLLIGLVVVLKVDGICMLIFVDMNFVNIEFVVKMGVDWVEFYIGFYVENYCIDWNQFIKVYVEVVCFVIELGLGINVGYDLNQENFVFFKQEIFELLEVFIGYVFIFDVIYFGLENIVQWYLYLLK